MKKYVKAALISTAAAAGICGAIGNLFVKGMLSKKGIRKLQKGPGMLDEESLKILHSSEESLESVEFYRKTRHREITAKSIDGKTLYALHYENSSDIYVIFCHGFTGDPNTDNIFAKRYHDMGFNVILPYSRAHGKSEHDYCTMGYSERLDIKRWCEKIAGINPDAKIVLHGVSMGSATVMMATGENLPENVRCCIADCGYTRLTELYNHMFGDNVLGKALLNCANTVSQIKLSFDFKKASPVDFVAKSKTPTLFIHGDKDTFVPFPMHKQLYDAASCEKEMLVVPDSPHAISELVSPDLYWSTVSDFIAKHTK